MALQEKYKELIETASTAGVSGLNIREQDGVLYIDGSTSGAVKQQLWDTYERLDPNYASGDLIMNINSVAGVAEGTKLKVTTNSSNLNIRKGPSTNDDIVGKAARNEVVTLVNKTNDQWWLIKTDQGEEGYSYTQYLTPLA